MKKLLLAIASLAFITSCGLEEPSDADTATTENYGEVSATFVQPEYAGVLDDSGIQQPETKGLDWRNGQLVFDPYDIARIGVMSSSSSSELMIYNLTTTDKDGMDAKFQVENFELKDGRYLAVFPVFSSTFGNNALSFPLYGQRQTASNYTSHLSAYSYYLAASDIDPSGGSFSFASQVAWLRITIYPEITDVFHRIVLDADGGFPQEGSLDMEGEKIVFSGDGPMTVLLGDEGESGIYASSEMPLTIYVTIPPKTYDNMHVTLEGKKLGYDATLGEGVRIEAGKQYDMTLDVTACKIEYTATEKLEIAENLDWGTGVTMIGHTFYEEKGKGRLTFSEPVTKISRNAFCSKENLTSIVLPVGIKSIDTESFIFCNNLISAKLPDSITSIGNFCFGHCTSLKEVTIPAGLTIIPSGYLQNTAVSRIEVPEGKTSIEEYAFSLCDSMTEIILPSTLKYVENHAFASYRVKGRRVFMKGEVPPELEEYALNMCRIEELHIPAGSLKAYAGFIDAINTSLIKDELPEVTVFEDQ